ncbi:MAG: deoxyribodipyrimidine photo-lyase [Acidobacteriota bacterium]
MHNLMNMRRGRLASKGSEGTGPVLYWMHRDHRMRDNWALLFAAAMAASRDRGLVVVHCLDPAYPQAAASHFRFLVDGLKELHGEFKAANIPFVELLGDPPARVAQLARDLDAAALVTDFDPLRHKRSWLARAGEAVSCPVHEVDARNVVPCFVASDKCEYMARTIRPKIHRLLPEFLEPFPGIPPLRPLDATGAKALPQWTWERVERGIPGLPGAPRPRYFAPGEAEARRALDAFTGGGLHGYALNRNDPSRNGQSGLSPWLHFGMLSAQRAALEAASGSAEAADKEAFLEELIVRRELADNFCLHRQDYDQTSCYPEWARKTLERHAHDPRPYIYTKEQLEAGETHDPAWNAAQLEMRLTGKMHGYMRMYWGKKILEWTPSAEAAQAVAVELNDRWSLDGRDPNGYAGIAWSIGGVHDRPWVERPIFGQVRYMNYKGLERKFDVRAYVEKSSL